MNDRRQERKTQQKINSVQYEMRVDNYQKKHNKQQEELEINFWTKQSQFEKKLSEKHKESKKIIDERAKLDANKLATA